MSAAADPATTVPRPDLKSRVDGLDWRRLGTQIDEDGYAVIERMLVPDECAALARLYEADPLFRKTIVMARHNFGRGEYRYFDYPLPDIVGSLRASIYPHLAAIANRWNTALGIEQRYPSAYPAFIEACRAAGQMRPTPLLLRYGPEDYNCLHQDLYGDVVFPLQLVIQLHEPGRDFTGGEFVLTEQRPRMQSRAEVIPLRQGDAAVFPVQIRPVRGTRGFYRVNMRHGVSRLRSGIRITAGIIFHDAK